ncbi:kinesin [Ophiocordyceps camponoti-floridani]|uniref:Kinesin-like protein n=1 Tax=Ophiocordyceps camponoti-floridani TaxID=2030778 RepID=A0A8H4VAK9_9HYPO|nr:kinesin [Ophiocordyceps camponoti-floridani]
MTALPRPARPSLPPTKALPPLPVAKTRKSTTTTTTAAADGSKPAPATLRRTTSSLTTTLAQPTANTRTLRKSVSINSFPQPPRRDVRTASMPPSPLRTVERQRTRKPKSPVRYTSSSTPSLLNASGEGKSVNTARMSDGLMSISSPPQSRSSSAQDSYSTSATTYEDSPDAALSSPDKRCSKSETKGNVLVSVRVRPDAHADPQGFDSEWQVDGRKSLIIFKGKEGGEYLYDNVFATQDNNARVYDHIAKRLVRRVMEGYHGTVFAYGMTGTGKTFSMQGTATSPGVIPLAITDIFSYIRETPSREFLLRVSYLEIYNEKIHDLLNMPAGNATVQVEEIKLREDSKRGVYATPLKEEIVQSPTQLLRVIARGDQARRTASTQFNARSSRSHAVVQIVVESRERVPTGGSAKRSGMLPGGVRISTLSLIDLAGSERAAESKERRQEGAHINKSLLTLGTVIAKLSEANDKENAKGNEKETKHLPYRDSKLTRLLQGALSGDSLVSILCTIQTDAAGGPASSSGSHTSETLNTLKFASRAKNSIVSHAKRAEEALGIGGDGNARVLLERYRVEIADLRQQLDEQTRNRASAPPGPENEKEDKLEKVRELEATERHEEQMLEMQLARTALKERIDHLNRLILDSKSVGVNLNGSTSSLSLYARLSQLSGAGSIRSSLASIRPLAERTSSITSASSTIGQRSSGGLRMAGDDGEGDDCVGELGDGTASLATQNRALRADLADKNRYIATLEKRLLQARRASSSRASVSLAGASGPGIMVGEDHSVAATLREKDAEIADLRARLDDKDRMLAALRTVTRNRDSAPGPSESRQPETPLRLQKRRTQGTDEMNRMLEEMIQDGVDTGHILRSNRGSVRLGSLTEPGCDMAPLTPVETESH